MLKLPYPGYIRASYSVDEMIFLDGYTQVEFEGSRLSYTDDFTRIYKLIAKGSERTPTWQRVYPCEMVDRLKEMINHRKQIRAQRHAEYLAEARR